MTWKKKKPDHLNLEPNPANLQPENGILGQPKPQSSAQSDAQNPQTRREKSNARKLANAETVNYKPKLKPADNGTPNRLHSHRKEAMQALALPDIAPPPSLIPQATEDMTEEQRAVLQALNLDSFAASINQNGEINAALAPQARTNGKINDHTDDELFELISRGYLQIEIARMWGVSPVAMSDYIRNSPQRSARMLRAKDNAAQACDAKAMEVLRTARPGEAYKARAISSYLQWRASRMSPDYQDASRVKVEGALVIQHETPDRAPITDLIAEALKPFSTKITDIDAE